MNSNAEDWVSFDNENVEIFEISKSQTLILEDLRFEIIWEKELIPNEKFGYLGGIKRMDIYKKDSLVNTFVNIEDVVGLGEISIMFYDYNMDGKLDFTLPISSGKNRWDKYFIYNREKNQFQYQPSWDYLRIQKFNLKEKLILSQPNGYNPPEIYSVSFDTLIFLKELK